MHRNMTRGLIAIGIAGAAVGMYAASNMKPRERKRMMKNGRRALGALGIMKGLDMF
ncbi:YtxH domain-containing protein [Alkaliphilus sp. B6464]|uniref:YtxH domain-containing protein n=1 Tax=Alkaliphilus sp. B6464 TaxID=2731219 RepID=UPI001BA7D8A8|nr:YtxH domain-containing protein [Alkaliphilus sp. B6464]QUH20615.1 YtxH domain-containing protein [Alkaliphilus sp. B6464]